MIKFKTKFFKLFNLSSILVGVVLTACTTNNSNTSSNNEWSLPSQKPGLIHAPNNLLTQASQPLVVSNYFKLSWKPQANQMNPWLLTSELNQSLNNKNDQPFDGSAKISNNFSSFNKVAFLDKYFVNANNFLPTWFVYDIRAFVIDRAINLLITMVDTNKLPSDSSYKVSETFRFQSVYQTPAVSELIKSTMVSVPNAKELLASNVKTTNFKIANQTELENNQITASYSELQPNDQTASLTVKLTLTDSANKTASANLSLSGFIKFDAADMLTKLRAQNFIRNPQQNDINVNTIKSRVDKYKEVVAKSTDANYATIAKSPALAWAYAVGATKSGADETQIKTQINSIATASESASSSKLAMLYPSLVNLTGLAFVLVRNTKLAQNSNKSDVENTLKTVVDDYLANYYYGTKADNSQQKIYKTPEVYEDQTPLALATIFYWKADLFDATTYQKFNNAINYFIPDVSKIHATGDRYVTSNNPTSKSNDSFNRLLNNVFMKIVSGANANQANEVNGMLEKFGNWMSLTPINPLEKNNPYHQNLSSSDDNQNWVWFVSQIDLLRKLHPSLVASKLLINYTNIYQQLITYAKETLFKTVITTTNVDNDSYLKLVGLFNIVARNARLSNQLEPVLKLLLMNKTKDSLTKFAGLWGFIQTEIKKLLPATTT